MPKTTPLTTRNKVIQQRAETTRRLKHLMSDQQISMTAVAELQGISPQAVSNQFRSGAVTIETLISVLYLGGELDSKMLKSW